MLDEGTVDESVWLHGGEHLGATIDKEVFKEIVLLRRTLHERPELAFNESFTAATVRERLGAIEGVRVLERAVGGTGVIGVLRGGLPGGKTILFRADLDGLPIQEVMSGSGGGAAAEGVDAEGGMDGEGGGVSDGAGLSSGGGVEDGSKRRKLAGGAPSADGGSGSGSHCPSCGLCPPPSATRAAQAAAAASATTTAPPANARAWQKQCMSQNAGVSHACGHDGHVAMLIGAAKVLAAQRSELRGTVVLLFQPAEERHSVNNPMGGAIRMIRDVEAGEELSRVLGGGGGDASSTTAGAGGGAAGVTEASSVSSSSSSSSLSEGKAGEGKSDADDGNTAWSTEERNTTSGFVTHMDGPLLSHVDEVYGAHLWNYASAGTVGCAPGSVTANSDSLDILITGTGGHASAPHGTVDPVVVAAQFITAAQCIISRNTSPTESAVITFGKSTVASPIFPA